MRANVMKLLRMISTWTGDVIKTTDSKTFQLQSASPRVGEKKGGHVKS